jgi:hypothetical protein
VQGLADVGVLEARGRELLGNAGPIERNVGLLAILEQENEDVVLGLRGLPLLKTLI